MNGGVEYGEYKPAQTIAGGSRLWPLSKSAQMAEVRGYLHRALLDTDADRVRGLSVVVEWNGMHNPNTVVRIHDKAFADENGAFVGECITEYTLDGAEIPPARWTEVVEDIRLLHIQYGIKPHDRPPQAPGLEPTA